MFGRRAAVLVTAALVLAVPAIAYAHDPGLSALDVRLSGGAAIVELSLAAGDARLACDSFGTIDAFATRTVHVVVDGVDRAASAGAFVAAPSGTTITLTFDARAAAQLEVRSDVPRTLARGHRELVTVRGASGEILARRMLDASLDSVNVGTAGSEPPGQPVGAFLTLGVRHILSGYDHLLFLAALLLGVRRARDVVGTVTAFTVAHSITLAASALAIVRVPPAIVEPLIAASIVVVGIENLVRGQVDSRWKLTFAFGLVHGFGFAAALRELGLGSNAFDVAVRLACFNGGVEVGQLGVVALMWPVIRRLNAAPQLRVRLAPACSLLVIGAGGYWMMQRLLWS
ncbi:MAG TPA: HupE/UreJ family protein [Vicinamibacterales bacterium]|nr:HupE/UreJ family protein [Vicinamibacterales bacterium]